jgi:hypothetical protein
MPAKTEKQKRFMDAAAHNPAFAKQAGVPVSVAKDFSAASKGIKFGGPKTRPDLQKVNEPKTRQGKIELFSKGGDTMASKMNPGFMAMMAKKKGDKPDALAKHAAKPASKAHAGLKSGGAVNGIATKGKTKGTMIKMARGGKSC